MTTEDAERLIASLRRINTVVTVDAAELLRSTLDDLAKERGYVERYRASYVEAETQTLVAIKRAEAAEAALAAEREETNKRINIAADAAHADGVRAGIASLGSDDDRSPAEKILDAYRAMLKAAPIPSPEKRK